MGLRQGTLEDMKPRSGTLMLVRHGESVANARELFTGVIDVGLTPSGERDCALAGGRLRQIGFTPDAIVTSELVRGWRTAELIAESIGFSGAVERDWHLNERNYGALSGHLKTEIKQRYGAEKFRYWRRSYDGRPPGLSEQTLTLWRRLPPFDRLPAEALTPTESLADVVERIRPWWHRDVVPRLVAGQDILLVSHGNTMRALAAVLDHLTPVELSALNLPNARPLRYDFEVSGSGATNDAGGPAVARHDGVSPVPTIRPVVKGGTYLDPEAAASEAALIAAQGGT